MPSTAYKYCEVGGLSPTAEHTEFWTPLIPMAGNTVGVTATLTISIFDCGIGGGGVLKGEPATSVTVPPLPMANTETEPGTVVPRLATNRNFPAGSITIMLGTTSPLNDTWLPTAVVVPLEFTLKARIPLVLPEQAGLVLIIA